jgi:BioD-like phosphotransacetylase family protein
MVTGLCISGSQQHAGKTIVCLGLVRALLDRGLRVGFMKPVGQRYMDFEGYRIDEDAVLIEQTYALGGKPPHINPVTVPRGFTADYIDHPDPEPLIRAILAGYEEVSADKDIVILEGTGHAGVGSVIDLSNARVAHLLRAPALVVATGGIGRPIDEFCLSANLFETEGVTVLGCVANKLLPSKRDQVSDYTARGLAHKHHEFLGGIARDRQLEAVTIRQILDELDATLINSAENLEGEITRGIIGAMAPHRALEEFTPGALALIPGDRDDLVITALSTASDGTAPVAGICLTGPVTPHATTMRLIERSLIPVLKTPKDTFEAATEIAEFVAKIRPGEVRKIEAAQRAVARYVSVDRILERLHLA